MPKANATTNDHAFMIENLFVYKFDYLYNDISFILCSMVLTALYKTRSKWNIGINTYMKLSTALIAINLMKTEQLLVYRYLYKDGDSVSCAIQGFCLIATEILNQLCVVFLTVEFYILIRIDLTLPSHVTLLAKKRFTIIRRMINKSTRSRNYFIVLLFVTIINCILIHRYYGFGSDKKNNPTYCNFHMSKGDMLYHWVTIFSPLAVTFFIFMLLGYLYSKVSRDDGTLQHNSRLRKSQWALFRKLMLLPLTFLVINVPFMLREFLLPVSIGYSLVPFKVLYILGSAMPGLIALCIWYQNSFVIDYLNKKVFCCCFQLKNKIASLSLLNPNGDARTRQMSVDFRESLISNANDDNGYNNGDRERVGTSISSLLTPSFDSTNEEEMIEINEADQVSL